jgi:SAM-dependent methyltransferase
MDLLHQEKAPIQDHYGTFYAERNPLKVYPVEFVVRTLLGSYPNLKLNRNTYSGLRILDLGFGDGRNMPLLHDLGFEIFGVEISEKICELTRTRMQSLGVAATLAVGCNARIPHQDRVFDYVLACHSCYYVTPGQTFDDNLREIARVLRPGGRFIFSLAKSDSYILADAEPLEDGHYRIRSDPYHLRNGSFFRAFSSRDEIIQTLGEYFDDFALGLCENDYYGIYEKVWIGTCLRKREGN